MVLLGGEVGDKMGMEALEEGGRPKLQEMLWDFWKEVGPIKQAILQTAFSSQW